MPIGIKQLIESIDPTRTVLFFGSGSSIPSRAPTVVALVDHLAKRFDLPVASFSLAEVASPGGAEIPSCRCNRGRTGVIQEPEAYRRSSESSSL